jgi:hypothetical protein
MKISKLGGGNKHKKWTPGVLYRPGCFHCQIQCFFGLSGISGLSFCRGKREK